MYNIPTYPLSNQVVVKSTKNNKKYIACFKNGQLYIEIFTLFGRSVDAIYSPSSFDEEYSVVSFNKKPKKTKAGLYHDKTIIYNDEFKCVINYKNNKNCFYVNWSREEKGKPMTYKSFKKNDSFESLNDFFIKKYDELLR